MKGLASLLTSLMKLFGCGEAGNHARPVELPGNDHSHRKIMKRSSFLFKNLWRRGGGPQGPEIRFSPNVFVALGSLHVGWHDFSSLRCLS